MYCVLVVDENLGVADENMGVVDENMGVVDENLGVVDRTAVGVVDNDDFFPDSKFYHNSAHSDYYIRTFVNF